MNQSVITIFITMVIPELPFIAIYLIGLVLAIVRRKRHNTVSILAGVYFFFKLIFSALGLAISIYTTYSVNQGHTYSEYMDIQQTFSVLSFLFGIFLFVILLYAVFGWREEPKPGISNEQSVQ